MGMVYELNECDSVILGYVDLQTSLSRNIHEICEYVIFPLVKPINKIACFVFSLR